MNGLGEPVRWDGDAAVVEPGALAEVLRFLRYEAEPNYDTLADLTAVAASIGVRHAAPEGYTGQAYGGGWSTWRQRRGFIHVEDHTKQVE